jgi:hypothetical protein
MGEWVHVKDLKPSKGDIIQFKRYLGRIEHWALYIDDIDGGQVIHVVVNVSSGGSSHSSSGGRTAKACIRKGSLIEVANGSKCRVNNLENCLPSRGLRARDPDDIVDAAKAMLDKDYDYDALNRNCEHFVTTCRFGDGFSGQTAATIKTAKKWWFLGHWLVVRKTLDRNGSPLNRLDHV